MVKVIARAQQYIYVYWMNFGMNDYNFHQVLIYQQSGCISQYVRVYSSK